MLILALEVIVQPQIQFHENFFIALFLLFLPLCVVVVMLVRQKMKWLNCMSEQLGYEHLIVVKNALNSWKSRIGGHRRSYSYYLFQSLKLTLFVNSFRIQKVAKELREKYGSFVQKNYLNSQSYLSTKANHYWKLFLIFWAPPIDII